MAKYSVGIDLGTTNSVVASCALEADQPQVELLAIPQLVAANTLDNRTALPSFLYLATAAEATGGALAVPWAKNRDFAVGEFARSQGAEVPDRTVTAAKSWLCHSRVDRHQDILPWKAPDDVPKVSPVTATQRYLEHLAAAWNAAHKDAPLAEQQVVLTVPASFDASARELTREAALAAGLPEDLVLLEEPQAAVYAWLDDQGDRWRKQLQVDETLLVVDVGGGTTDLTLVGVAEEQGELVLNRMAVGNHLLVGGDNMDLALAHYVSQQFAAEGVKLDAWQSISLWHACRAAKEKLLGAQGPEKLPLSVKKKGAKLVGGTVKIEIDRQQVAELLAGGFFPACKLDDQPQRGRASGFMEIGLPFEQDTGVTRHIAAFLAAHGDGQPVRPTHILFNGGVFKAQGLSDQLFRVLKGWFGKQAPELLPGGHDLDHAVARGAAYYGWSKHSGGIRIRGGTARSYYVGIESSGLAIPGAPRPLRALCVVPMGMEEGTEADVPSDEIGLVVGEPAHFRFFSSSVRHNDRPGDVIDRWDEGELEETDPLEGTLEKDKSITEPYVPVRFQSRVTELGMFELWCKSTQSDRRWKLEFSVREDAEE